MIRYNGVVDVQALVYHLFRALSRVACALPRRTALGIGAGFAALVYRIYRLTPYRDFLYGNLRAAFPEAPAPELHAIALCHLQMLTRAIAEVLRLPLLTRDNLSELVRFEGQEHLEAALAEGRGVLIATAHFGNWELLGAALALAYRPLHVLVQRPSQDAFDRLFKEFRGLAGVHTWLNSGPASLRPALRALSRNEMVGLLCDQHGESQEAIVDFFGHPVSAPTGAFFFAQRTGAAIVPVFAIRQPDDTHVLRFEPAIAPSGDVEADAQRLYDLYERMIRMHPDHWLWVHDRWAREGELRARPKREEVPA
ncbi:MAG TPA: lysophospholipid acyltransferase family protein [Oscillatoriaceae cyanobacterium]